MGLLHFNKNKYTSLDEAFSAIKRELMSLIPTDTKDVRWSRGADGMRAYTNGNAGGGGADAQDIESDTQQYGTKNSVMCVNSSGKKLYAGSYVTLYTAHGDSDDPFEEYYYMTDGISDPCGILLQDCERNDKAEVQISGLAVAPESPAPPDIITLPAIGPERKNLVILGSTGHYNYANYFKVAATAYGENGKVTQLRIFDGADTTSSTAGWTDCGLVSSAVFDGVFNTGLLVCLRLCVNFNADGSRRISQQLETCYQRPGEKEPVIILAEIIKTGERYKVAQRWTGGEIHWRNRFVVPFNDGVMG